MSKSRNATIEIYTDKRGAWRWRLRSANGRIQCQGECHTRRRDAERAAEAVRRAMAGARVVRL